MGINTDKVGRRDVPRGLRAGGLALVLLLLVAAPVLAASGPSSESSYTFAATGAQGAAGLWHKTGQVVSITATPSVDATVTAHFSSDGGVSWTTRSAANTRTATWGFLVDDEGANPIRFYASDTSGAPAETAHAPGFVNIDRTEPTITATGLSTTASQTVAAGWSQDTTGTATFTATDTVRAPGVATSGLQQISRSVNGGSPVIVLGAPTMSFSWVKGLGGVVEGGNAVLYTAKDWAGNSVSGTGYINIDTVEPTTTASPQLASSPTTGWRSTEVTVTLDWLDVSSGVPEGGTRYWVDGGNPTVYRSPFPVALEGSNKLEFRSMDRAGNLETTQTAYVNIDRSVPTVAATTAPAGNKGWYNTDVTVTLAGSGSPSGIAKTQYRLDTAPPSDWDDAAGNQFTVAAAASGIMTFEYRAVNGAGTASAAKPLEVKMDVVRPQASGKDASGKVNKSITLKYRFTDDLSPKVEQLYVKITNSKGKVVSTKKLSGAKNVKTWYSFTWKPSKKGAYKYYMHGSDLAGNTAKTKPAKITVK
jgi:hypothetical protein